MAAKEFKKCYGIAPAARTIWNADESYNKKGMEKYLTWLLDNGAQCLSIVGSTGENMAMSEVEQKEVLGIWNDLSTNEQETVMSMLRGLRK